MDHDAEYKAAVAAHNARLAQLQAEHDAEYVALEARIAACHAKLDALGAPPVAR